MMMLLKTHRRPLEPLEKINDHNMQVSVKR